MKDFLNRDLALDDFVVFSGSYGDGMKLGKIIKFTPKNIKIEHPTRRPGTMTTTLRASNQCVKVDGPDLTFFLLSRQNQG